MAQQSWFTVPNAVTFTRAALGVAAFIAAFGNRFDIAAPIFLVAGLTDFIDGIIARHTSVESRYGRLFDTAADGLLVYGGVIVLLVVQRIPVSGWILLGVLTFSAAMYVRILLVHGVTAIPRFTGKEFLPLKRYGFTMYVYVTAMFYGVAPETLTLVAIGVALSGTYLTGYHVARQQ